MATIGTRWLCRRSAPTQKRKRPLQRSVLSQMFTHRGLIIRTNKRELIHQAIAEAVVMSHAYTTSSETIQASKSHMHQLSPFSACVCIHISANAHIQASSGTT